MKYIVKNDGGEYLCPWTVYRLDFSDSYNELPIEAPDLGCLKAVTLDVGIAK
jgi:hypothetical protein